MYDDHGVPLLHRYDRLVVRAEERLAQTGICVGRLQSAVDGNCLCECGGAPGKIY